MFILVMEGDGPQYKARLYANDLSGDPLAAHTFAVDVADLSERFRETKSGDALLALGQELFDLVAPALGPYQQARAARESRRLLLNVADEQLNTLPWELMIEDNVPLFNDPVFPICRIQWQQAGVVDSQQEDSWPLRLLLVVASEENDPRVAAEKEVAAIVDEIVPHEAGIDWKLLTRPRRDELLNELERFKPHVLHFIGHGGVSHGKPVLRLFDPERGRNENWDVINLRNDLTGKASHLRLAFINACRTSEAAADGLWSLTDAFLDAGAMAVIGTRAEIAGEAAARCAAAFYRELFADLAVDAAMARARAHMSALTVRDWATPSLELRLRPPDLFSKCFTPHANPNQITRLFWEARKYVGRQEIFRQAWEARLAKEKRVAVIKGAADVGKSAAATMLLERCLLANHRARYVNMEQRGRDYVDLMRATLEGDREKFPPEPHTAPFPETLRNKFKNELLPATLGPALSERRADNVRRLFTEFRTLIEEAFPDDPIFLVYDQLDGMELNSLIETIKQFSRWHTDDSRVHTMLVLGEQKEQELLQRHIPLEAPHFNVLPIKKFRAEHYPALSAEFVRRLALARQVRDGQPLEVQAYETYKEHALRLVSVAPVPESWLPEVLVSFEDLFKKLDLLPNE